MRVLFWGTVIFCLAFLLHLVVWKVCLPKRQTKVLLMIFFSTLLAGVITLRGAPLFIAGMGLPVPSILPDYLLICLFFISLTLAYMITYSAIEVDSPSLVMVIAIARTGKEGLDIKQFERTMTDELLVVPRVRDLVHDKMVSIEGGQYRLTPKGLLLARLFIMYRKLLNVSKGG